MKKPDSVVSHHRAMKTNVHHYALVSMRRQLDFRSSTLTNNMDNIEAIEITGIHDTSRKFLPANGDTYPLQTTHYEAERLTVQIGNLSIWKDSGGTGTGTRIFIDGQELR